MVISATNVVASEGSQNKVTQCKYNEGVIMKRVLVFICVMCGLAFSQDMIVRVYVPSWKELYRIPYDVPFDIAGACIGEWYDIVADHNVLAHIQATGMPYEVVIHSIAYEMEKYRANYLSYTEISDSLRSMAQNHPSICIFDSLPIPTYEGNWLYGIKISDNPQIEEDDEPGVLIDGLHHSKEWASPIVVLFFADSMLASYGIVNEITDIINSREIYIFPIINADGYLYDYPTGYNWRKNREPFGGSVGTDPNRNYAGACCGDIEGDWGTVDEYQGSHQPSSNSFCGAYINSGDETSALAMFVRSQTINAHLTYHSYGEYVIWSYGWTSAGTPDSLLIQSTGTYMAGLMQRLGGGTYTPISGYGFYPTSGVTDEWVYGYNHFVKGISCLAYTIEVGTAYYQPQSDLDNICRENFKAAKYLAHFADSIIILTDGVVPPPDIYPLDSVPQNYTIAWHAKFPNDNHPIYWELVELSSPSIIEDDLESGDGRWVLEGFILSTVRAHSGSYSLFSGSQVNMNHAAQTLHPYMVMPGDSLTFWCWYSLQSNRDVAVVEISENTKEWFSLDDRFTSESGGWVRKSYSLENWTGKSVHFRFRSMTDPTSLLEGFYVDDIAPICVFQSIDTISSSLPDTFYYFSDHTPGDFSYLVKGYNTMWGWGDYSCLEKTHVMVGIAEGPSNFQPSVDQFTGATVIKGILRLPEDMRYKIFDITGRQIHTLNPTPGIYFIVIDGVVIQKIIRIN